MVPFYFFLLPYFNYLKKKKKVLTLWILGHMYEVGRHKWSFPWSVFSLARHHLTRSRSVWLGARCSIVGAMKGASVGVIGRGIGHISTDCSGRSLQVFVWQKKKNNANFWRNKKKNQLFHPFQSISSCLCRRLSTIFGW